MSPLIVAVLIAQATIYVWTDKAGVEHFTDDVSTIPKGVKVRTTDGEDISYVLPDPPKDQERAQEKDQEKPQEATVAAPSPAPAPSAGPEAPSVAEQTWRQLFRAARNKVTVLEEEIESDRKKVEEVNGLPMSFGFNCFTSGFITPVLRQPPINTTGVSVTANGQNSGQIAPGAAVGANVHGSIVIAPPPLVAPFGQTVAPIVTPCAFVFSPEFAMIRDRLERNRRELPRAREELADLERRAANEAVPLHWRR